MINNLHHQSNLEKDMETTTSDEEEEEESMFHDWGKGHKLEDGELYWCNIEGFIANNFQLTKLN